MSIDMVSIASHGGPSSLFQGDNCYLDPEKAIFRIERTLSGSAHFRLALGDCKMEARLTFQHPTWRDTPCPSLSIPRHTPLPALWEFCSSREYARAVQAVGQAFQPDVRSQAGKPDLRPGEQHCKLFHNRPFVWQIWDGFSCLVNYHKLNYKTLDNLTHSYLESWIKKQAGDAKTGTAGAEGRLAAALALQEKLKLILAGEPPYDIFVRWKPLHEQPIGWNPDLNDGVRMNIRPFT